MSELTETQVKPLSSYFDEIVESCKDCEIGGCDYDGYDYQTNSLYFENDDYMIEGTLRAAGNMTEDGDGYWTPRVTLVTHASVSVDEITGYAFNPETEDFDIEIPENELNALADYIEKNLPDYLVD